MTRTIDEEKRLFIEHQVAVLSVMAAIQHNPTYNKDVTENDKKSFRIDLFCELRKYGRKYGEKVEEAVHMQYILDIASALSKKHKLILFGGVLRIGTVQKALNLYLKYLWCMGFIEIEPPHCPIDRGVIIKAEGSSNPSVNWTRIKNTGEYKTLMTKIVKLAGDQQFSPAEWELKEWNTPKFIPAKFSVT